MPLVDATFLDENGRSDHARLLECGPSVAVIVSAVLETAETQASRTTFALIDTGATQSCIDAQLAQSLHLPVVDRITIGGASGTSEHDVYAARVLVPQLDMAQYGAFAGVDLSGGSQPHGVLLGRTFLLSTVVIYDGLRGQITIATPRPLQT